jgi:hypothetical protein
MFKATLSSIKHHQSSTLHTQSSNVNQAPSGALTFVHPPDLRRYMTVVFLYSAVNIKQSWVLPML